MPPKGRTQTFNARVPAYKASVLTNVDDATVNGITEEVIAHGVALLEPFSLGSADALHISCASAMGD